MEKGLEKPFGQPNEKEVLGARRDAFSQEALARRGVWLYRRRSQRSNTRTNRKALDEIDEIYFASVRMEKGCTTSSNKILPSSKSLHPL